MLTAWSMADFTRYVFYCAGLLRDLAGSCRGVAVAMKMLKVKSVERADDPVFKIPFPLVWIRYSLFLILYPTGVFAELMCIRMTMDGATGGAPNMDPMTTSGWTLQTVKYMLGGMGFLQSQTVYYTFIVVCYVLGLPPLYMTLLGARRKQLAPPPKTDKAKKTQ
jgi:hypothetical protein